LTTKDALSKDRAVHLHGKWILSQTLDIILKQNSKELNKKCCAMAQIYKFMCRIASASCMKRNEAMMLGKKDV